MSKYNREIIGLDGTVTTVDCYRVLDAFNVTDPATQHAIKKMLCAGLRGHKDYLTDIDDSIESLKKAKELYCQRVIDNAKSDKITHSILNPEKEAKFDMPDGSYFTFGKTRI